MSNDTSVEDLQRLETLLTAIHDTHASKKGPLATCEYDTCVQVKWTIECLKTRTALAARAA